MHVVDIAAVVNSFTFPTPKSIARIKSTRLVYLHLALNYFYLHYVTVRNSLNHCEFTKENKSVSECAYFLSVEFGTIVKYKTIFPFLFCTQTLCHDNCSFFFSIFQCVLLSHTNNLHCFHFFVWWIFSRSHFFSHPNTDVNTTPKSNTYIHAQEHVTQRVVLFCIENESIGKTPES